MHWQIQLNMHNMNIIIKQKRYEFFYKRNQTQKSMTLMEKNIPWMLASFMFGFQHSCWFEQRDSAKNVWNLMRKMYELTKPIQGNDSNLSRRIEKTIWKYPLLQPMILNSIIEWFLPKDFHRTKSQFPFIIEMQIFNSTDR